MPNGKLTVIVSAGQSRSPDKRQLEQAIAEAASQLAGVHVVRIPHLYDLAKDGETYRTLRKIDGHLVFISWLFTRAAHWILDRNGIQGQVGEVELRQDFDDEAEEPESAESEAEQPVIDAQPRPNRKIYTLDFRASSQAQDFIAEIERIAGEHAGEAGTPLTLEMLSRFESPTNDTYLGNVPSEPSQPIRTETLFGSASVLTIDEHPSRRWYPVIDFSRCTNCMECIDFCLFGVYGIDSLETIIVEQADNCRKGCPACSRVCPQNAIIFPQHKTPAIAGAPVDASGMKIDLSKLFGAPEDGEDAAAAAIRERDEQLVLAGRQAVGTSTGISDRLTSGKGSQASPDKLDDLIDQLDSLDL